MKMTMVMRRRTMETIMMETMTKMRTTIMGTKKKIIIMKIMIIHPKTKITTTEEVVADITGDLLQTTHQVQNQIYQQLQEYPV